MSAPSPAAPLPPQPFTSTEDWDGIARPGAIDEDTTAPPSSKMGNHLAFSSDDEEQGHEPQDDGTVVSDNEDASLDPGIVMTLPRHLQFAEDSGLYPEVMSPVHREYRKADRPKPFVQGNVKKRQTHPAASANCSVILSGPGETGQRVDIQFGAIFGRSDTKWINYRPHLDSQYPHHELFWRIPAPGGKVDSKGKGRENPGDTEHGANETTAKKDYRKISWVVYPDSIEHGMGPDGSPAGYREHTCEIGPRIKRDLVPHDLQEVADENTLAQITFKLFNKNAESPGYGPPVGVPRFLGISPMELETLLDAHKAGMPLSIQQMLVVMLYAVSGHTVAIHRVVNPANGGVEQYRRMLRYLDLVMWKTARSGFFWHYTAQTNLALDDPDFPFDDVKPPRWLIKQWKLDYDARGEPCSAEPLKWAQLLRPHAWPNVITQTFAYRLSVARQAKSWIGAIQESLDQQAGTNTVYFEQDPRDSRRYIGYVSAIVTNSHGAREVMRAEPGTKIRIMSGNHTVKGVIVPDFGNGDSWAVIYVFSPHKKMLFALKDCSITLSDNKTLFERHDRALVRMSSTLERTEGMDLHTVLYQQFPVIPKPDRDPWANTLSIEQKTAFFELFHKFKPNDRQFECARLFCESREGFLALWGPPGTGKSYTLAAIIFCYIVTNKKFRKNEARKWNVLMGAPTNEAAAGLLDEMVNVVKTHLTPDSGVKITLTYFKGSTEVNTKPQSGPTRFSKQQIEKAQEDSNVMDVDTDDITDVFNDAAGDLLGSAAIYEVLECKFGSKKEKHGDLLFSKARVDAAVNYRKDKTHPMYQTAREYIKVNNTLYDDGKKHFSEKMPVEERELILQQKRELEESIGIYYLNYDVDCVLSTYNRCYHPTIMENFFADLVVADECPLASIPNFLSLLSSQKETAVHAIAAGDHRQQEDVAMAQDRNEFYDMSNESTFKRLIEDPNPDAFSTVTLDTQYRMHPECAQTTNTLWYDGMLRNHESTEIETDDWITAHNFFQQKFGAAYHDERVFGIDCSDSPSEQFSTGTTLRNEGEVGVIIKLIRGMISHMPPPGGRRLEPRDFLVLPFYQGQEYMLNGRLIAAFGGSNPEVNYPRENRVHVNTVGGSQGRQGLIVIISFTRNVLDKPDGIRFIANEKALNVALSRQKHCRILVGAIRTWLNMHRKGYSKFRLKKSPEYKFGLMIEELYPAGGLCRVISNYDFEKGMGNQVIEGSTFMGSVVEYKRKLEPASQQGHGSRPQRVRRVFADPEFELDWKQWQGELEVLKGTAPPGESAQTAMIAGKGAALVEEAREAAQTAQPAFGDPKRPRQLRGGQKHKKKQ